MSVVKFHLTQAKHFSASLYNVQGEEAFRKTKIVRIQHSVLTAYDFQDFR